METPRAYAVRRAIASDAPALAALARVTEEQSAVRSRVHHLLTLDDRAVHVAETGLPFYASLGLTGDRVADLGQYPFFEITLRPKH